MPMVMLQSAVRCSPARQCFSLLEQQRFTPALVPLSQR